jgi:hypothetical protein
MRVDLGSHNPALISIFKHPEQIITMDANLLIPPDRSRYIERGFDFPLFQKVWLDPIFAAFPNLAIHEAVYEELVMPSVQSYVQSMLDASPARLIIHRDACLTAKERMLRDSIEARVFPLTKYDPMIDNKDDRGEVKSLAYIAVKGLPYFAAHDTNVILLIEKAEAWSTGLDNIQVIKMNVVHLQGECQVNYSRKCDPSARQHMHDRLFQIF